MKIQTKEEVIDLEESLEDSKRKLLRNNEYYNMQTIFDNLYSNSKKGYKFTKLMSIITDERNILLAYRNIKNNKGSNIAGVDGKDISFFEKMDTSKFISRIQNQFKNYKPKAVRRVMIPKRNGKLRPLGIPCIEDRIIQQCIKQVLEPICEAKFHKHSYGFRPNRSAKHALARSMFLMNVSKLHYAVDIDIKSFFDNVDHSKLKKQMWNIGIQDKNLMCIISKILKSEIQGEGIPTKGTPQGGIISPLLSNIVLNELDWWLSSQWETFETNKTYSHRNRYKFIKASNLKEFFFVRYADDFKIFCRDYKTARKILIATKKWLKERLNLEISEEKTKITNLRKNYSEYLGIKLKVELKGKKYVCQSRVSNKSVSSMIEKLKKQIKVIQKNNNPNEVNKYNSIILGFHGYYSCASNANKDFTQINYLVLKTLDKRLKVKRKGAYVSEMYRRLYGSYKRGIRSIGEITLFPIHGCTNIPPMNFSQDICDYTPEGRSATHRKLKDSSIQVIYSYLKTSNKFTNQKLFDNSISLLAGQYGRCYVSGRALTIGNMECHHRKPKSMGGGDDYRNLAWLTYEIHKLVHAVDEEIIKYYSESLNLNEKGVKRLNYLRKLVGNSEIKFN